METYYYYSATCPDWFCSTSYPNIPVAVAESEVGVVTIVDFHQVGHFVLFERMFSEQYSIEVKSCKLVQAF